MSQLSLPFRGDYDITQLFGERPWVYAQFTASYCPPGTTLAGHNGVDYGVPSGTPLLSIDDGVILAVSHSDQGYGHHVFIRHDWGESVYAHMSRIYVTVGQSVLAGEEIGLSGYTGFVEPAGPNGAHLHFGIRPHGTNRCNDFFGYVDPLPYLFGASANGGTATSFTVGAAPLILIAGIVLFIAIK